MPPSYNVIDLEADEVRITMREPGSIRIPDPSGKFMPRLPGVQLLTHLHANAFAQWHTGSQGELRFGLTVPPMTVPGLDTGLDVPPPLFTVGGGLRLDL